MNQSGQCEKNILPQITAGLFLWLYTCHVSAVVSCAAASATHHHHNCLKINSLTAAFSQKTFPQSLKDHPTQTKT